MAAPCVFVLTSHARSVLLTCPGTLLSWIPKLELFALLPWVIINGLGKVLGRSSGLRAGLSDSGENVLKVFLECDSASIAPVAMFIKRLKNY